MSGAATRGGLGPFDPYWTRETPSPRRRRALRIRVLLGSAAVAAMIGVASFAPGHRQDRAPPAASVDAATRAPEHIDVAAAPAFLVAGLDAAETHYEARIGEGGERRDALMTGSLAGAGPSLRLETWREGGRATASLYVAAAEIAAASGAAVERLGATQRLVTDVGALEWSKLTLAGREGGCAAFRLAAGGGTGFRGVLCGPAGANVTGAELACLTERIELTRSGREAGLAPRLQTSQRRAACHTPFG